MALEAKAVGHTVKSSQIRNWTTRTHETKGLENDRVYMCRNSLSLSLSLSFRTRYESELGRVVYNTWLPVRR